LGDECRTFYISHPGLNSEQDFLEFFSEQPIESLQYYPQHNRAKVLAPTNAWAENFRGLLNDDFYFEFVDPAARNRRQCLAYMKITWSEGKS
jgi:hypothetical protein